MRSVPMNGIRNLSSGRKLAQHTGSCPLLQRAVFFGTSSSPCSMQTGQWYPKRPPVWTCPSEKTTLHLPSTLGWEQRRSLKLFCATFEGAGPEQSSKPQDGSAADPAAVEQLATELKEAKEKNEELLDKYRRAIAENDNMRKRLTKQIEDAKVFGIQGFCKDLLEVADVLGKAVEAAKANDRQNPAEDSMLRGLELTETQLHQVFGRHGLARISPHVGQEKFDPNVHEALFQVPAPDREPNIVMDVQKIGYSLHGRTIRPALVGVSRK